MNRKAIAAVLLLSAVLAACAAPSGDPTAKPVPELPAAVIAARAELSATEGIPVEEIEVTSYESREWTDGCLGLGRADEGCLQVITPGYQVVMEAAGDRFVYRTDQTGLVIRREP